MLVPAFAVFTQNIGGSVIDAGIGFAIFSIVSGILVITVGRTTWFRTRATLMIFLGYFIAVCGDLLYIAVRTKSQLFLVQAIVGVAVGLLNPAWDALYSEEGEQGDATVRWSIWNGGANFATGVGALVGTFAIAKQNFTLAFVLMAGMHCISAYYGARIYLMGAGLFVHDDSDLR
jgi:hypothetical protein